MKLCLYVIALMLVLTSNTLYCILGRWQLVFSAILLLAMLTVCVRYSNVRLSRPAVIFLVVWLIALFGCNALLFALSGDSGGSAYAIFILVLAISPVAFLLLRQARQLGELTKAFVNVAVFFAVTSLILWLIGPICGFLQPNCSISNSWTGTLGLTVSSPGYFYLLYDVQSAPFLGVRIVRNTSIFAEAPMFSLVLCVALLFEVFGERKPRLGHVVTLSLAIISSVSTTGIVVLLLVALIAAYRTARRAGRTRVLLYMLLGLLVAFGVVAMVWLLNEKSGTASGMTRVDDFVAGYKAWRDHVWVGTGISSSDFAAASMSAFRSDNVGFSNGLMSSLARGGLLFSLPIFFGWAAFFFSKEPRDRITGALFLVLWVFTNITFLPITGAMVGLGICFCSSELQGDASRRRGRATDRKLAPWQA
jgi:hypothetical protein